jgi:hypothetical protein
MLLIISGKPQGFHQGPQGQFSQQNPNHIPPPPNFHQGQLFMPPQQHHQAQQIFITQSPSPASPQQQQQQQQQIFIQQSTPSGDIIIQKANDLTPGQGETLTSSESGRSVNNNNRPIFQGNSAEARQQHHPMGLVPPLPPHAQRFQGPVRGEQPMKHGLTSGEISKNIIRELFERKPPGMKDGRPNGGFFGPPQPQGQSQPKVMNRPGPNGQQKRPGQQGGGLFGGKEIALSTNDLNAEGGEIGPAVQYGGPGPFAGGSPDGAWPSGPDGDMPKIVSLEVKCEKNVMRVFVAFDKPFFGVIFSKVY